MLSQRDLIRSLQRGLPIVERPYEALASELGCDEDEVIDAITRLQERHYIKRLGLVLRHRPLGYTANAMVVWDVPDDEVDAVGHCFGSFDFVTLSYQRPRQLPDWPYNLFSMIHGQSRDQVYAHLEKLVQRCGVQRFPHEVLFSKHCFKQRGAFYIPPENKGISA